MGHITSAPVYELPCNASYINSGTLNINQLPAHNASYINVGVINSDRIPYSLYNTGGYTWVQLYTKNANNSRGPNIGFWGPDNSEAGLAQINYGVSYGNLPNSILWITEYSNNGAALYLAGQNYSSLPASALISINSNNLDVAQAAFKIYDNYNDIDILTFNKSGVLQIKDNQASLVTVLTTATRKFGSATLNISQTSVNVAHSFGGTPTIALISPTSAWGGHTSHWVSAKGNTSFTITVNQAVTSAITFDWMCM